MMKHLKLFEGFHVSDYYHKANLSDTNNQFYKLRKEIFCYTFTTLEIFKKSS